MVRIATPLLLGAMGELVTERSGVMNLGIEGTMLMSSFVAFLVDFETNSIILAILAAMLTGALMSLIMAFMASTMKVDQTVTGLSLNLLASGISLFWYRVAFKGTSTEVHTHHSHDGDNQDTPISVISHTWAISCSARVYSPIWHLSWCR